VLEALPDVPAFTRRIDAPFVGRKRELDLLLAKLDETTKTRSPHLVTIVGPPGIGKSRLARELIQRSDARVLVGRCLSYGDGITYLPLEEVVSEIGDVGAALGEGAEADLAAARIAAAIGTSETAVSSDEIAWGFRKLFEALAKQRPLMVVLDDIHWAEPTLLDLVEYLARFSHEAPLLLLCIARPDLFERRPAWAAPTPNTTLAVLEPLTAVDAETLVEELRDVTDATKLRIVEVAEGNPLFVEQLVAMEADAADGELEVPPTIQALLSARIDRLEPGEREVLGCAAVEGRLFHRGGVAELVPRNVGIALGGSLMALVRKELIRPDRATVSGDDGFRFSHVLIRDAAYEALPKRRRAELHERFAGWLGSRLPDQAPDEILGYHLEQAYRYRIEFGPEDEQTRELALRAGRLLAQAGRRAHAKDDATAVLSLLGRATRLLSPDDPERAELLLLLGETEFAAGDAPRSTVLLREARTLAVATGQRSIELRARLRENGFLAQASPTHDTAAILVEAYAAIDELTQLDDVQALGVAWWLVAMVGNWRGDFALKEHAASRFLDCARQTGSPTEVAWAVAVLSAALEQGPTPADEAIRRIEEAHVEFAGDRRPGEASLAMLYACAGRFAEAEAAITRTRRVEFDLGRRLIYAAMSMELGRIALLAGEPGCVEAEMREAAELMEAAGELGWMSTVAAILAEVLYQLDRDDEAEEWTRRSEGAASPDDSVSQALWRATRAKVLARRDGDAAHALKLSEESVDQARLGNSLAHLGDCLSSRAEVLRRLGRADEARPLLEEALSAYEQKGIIPAAERVRALLLESIV
jgi:tetratricopeptide (TPR) repeat protein